MGKSVQRLSSYSTSFTTITALAAGALAFWMDIENQNGVLKLITWLLAPAVLVFAVFLLISYRSTLNMRKRMLNIELRNFQQASDASVTIADLIGRLAPQDRERYVEEISKFYKKLVELDRVLDSVADQDVLMFVYSYDGGKKKSTILWKPASQDFEESDVVFEANKHVLANAAMRCAVSGRPLVANRTNSGYGNVIGASSSGSTIITFADSIIAVPLRHVAVDSVIVLVFKKHPEEGPLVYRRVIERIRKWEEDGMFKLRGADVSISNEAC